MSHLQRSLFLASLALLLSAIIPQIAVTAELPGAKGGVLWVYIGTYTKTPESGINFCQFDLATGSLTKPEVVAKTPNPTFLALSPKRPLLYAINEVSQFEAKKVGSIMPSRFRRRLASSLC